MPILYTTQGMTVQTLYCKYYYILLTSYVTNILISISFRLNYRNGMCVDIKSKLFFSHYFSCYSYWTSWVVVSNFLIWHCCRYRDKASAKPRQLSDAAWRSLLICLRSEAANYTQGYKCNQEVEFRAKLRRVVVHLGRSQVVRLSFKIFLISG